MPKRRPLPETRKGRTHAGGSVMTQSMLSLDTLAHEINDEHSRCELALRRGLTHALRAGELLIQAKALCEYGTWLPWLRDNFTGSTRTAEAYMRVARDWPRLAEANPQRAANLSYRAVVKLLATPHEGGLGDDPLEDMQVEIAQLEARWHAVEKAPTSATLAEVASDALRLQNQCAEIKLRAEREAGLLAAELTARLVSLGVSGHETKQLTTDPEALVALCDEIQEASREG